jgi:hypothetical protein
LYADCVVTALQSAGCGYAVPGNFPGAQRALFRRVKPLAGCRSKD